MMNEKIYKTYLIENTKKKIFILIFILSLLLNIIIYSYIFINDFKSSYKLRLSYQNTLSIKTKTALLNINNLKIQDFLKILNRDYLNFHLYEKFLNFLLNSKLKQEIKFNLVLYSIESFEKIKESYIFDDLKTVIFVYFEESKEDILKLIERSLKTEPIISNHNFLLTKEVMNKYKNEISDLIKPKTYYQKTAYLQFLMQAGLYEKSVDFILKENINIDKNWINYQLSSYLLLIKDKVKAEKILIKAKDDLKTDYSYYFLGKFYFDNNNFIKASETLSELLKFDETNKDYLLLLIDSYFNLQKYNEAIYVFGKLPHNLIKTNCYKIISSIKNLNIETQIKELLKFSYICDKKLIYKELINLYKQKNDLSSQQEYELKLKLIE